jgi:signal transduction histidine kinase/ActR/RegA family two-component response regulator
MTDELPLAAQPVENRSSSLRRRLADWMAARLGVDRKAELEAGLAAAEARARQAEARLHEVVEAIPEGIVMLDAEGRYILWNQTYAEIYHRSADLFEKGARLVDTLRVGIARGDYPDAEGREEDWLAARVALMNNPGPRHEQRIADGRWLMIEERKTSEGGIIGLRVDITDMKRQAQALEAALHRAEAANRAKTDFLANLSHEIRTPLNGVLGLADVLAQTSLEPSQQEVLRSITTSAGALNQVLVDLLDFSHLEAGTLEIAPEPFRIAEVVAESAALFEESAKAKAIALEVELSGLGDAPVIGDPARLRQILTNLICNAIKFTETGRVVVRASAVEAGGAYRFVVEDTGAGFDPEDAERLFARFEQADSSMTRRHGGLGLGLAICRQLSELMGGSIGATAQPGKGAVFTLTLPFPPAEPVEAEPADAPETGGTPLRVLVTDDNPTNRMVAELIMNSIGAVVVCAENGQEALDAVDRLPFDVVLMDLQMPVMDGITAIRAIREREASRGLPRLPVVVVSANVMREQREETSAAGADDHLGKPIRAEELIAAVVRAIQSSEPESAAA